MPLDVLGCTRATLESTKRHDTELFSRSLKAFVDWDSRLKLFDSNEEFLVIAIHHIAMNTSLPFVHTARRSYRLNDPVNYLD